MRVTEPYTIFPRKLASGKTVYYYQFRSEEGIRSSAKSTGCTSLSAARRYCQKLYNSGKFAASSALKFSDFTADFLSEDGDFRQWKKANGKDLKPETVRRYRNSLENLLQYFSSMEIKKITPDTCKKWVVWASSRWSAKTVNNDQGLLNIIFESAIDKDLISANPLRRLGMRKVVKKQRILLTVDELNKLYNLQWPNETQKKAFVLAAITGMRLGEIVALRKTDIQTSYIDVSHDYSERYGLQGSTKTGIQRKVPVPKAFEYPGTSTEWVFDGENGKPVMPHCIYNAFWRRCDALGIKRKERGIDFHSLRDFFVTYMRTNNVSDAKIRGIVGHADTTMTDLYTHWSAEMFAEVYGIQDELYQKITGGTQ